MRMYTKTKKTIKCAVYPIFQAPAQYFHNEQPLDLNGATCAAATDYTKRPNVFRLKMASGGEWLFQCRDEVSFTDKLIV